MRRICVDNVLMEKKLNIAERARINLDLSLSYCRLIIIQYYLKGISFDY